MTLTQRYHKYGDGGPIKKFYSDYMGSPNYKKRLQGQGYTNPEKVIADRKKQLSATTIVDTDLLDTQFHPKAKVPMVTMNPKQLKSAGLSYTPTLAHELSHASGALSSYNTSNPNLRLNTNEEKQFEKRNLLSSIKTGYGSGLTIDQTLEIGHDKKPSESKADMDSLRYLLKKDKIYDTGTQQFNPEHLKKAKQKYKNDFNSQRLFSNFKDADLIYLMNNIASTNNSQPFTMAKYGGQLSRRYRETALTKYSTGGVFSPDPNKNLAIEGVIGAIPAVAATGSSMIRDEHPVDGYRTTGNLIAKRGLTGMAMGAQAGKAFGPLGTVIGGAVGTGIGTLSGLLGAKGIHRKWNQEREDRFRMQANADEDLSAARIAGDPTLTLGNRYREMYANGGQLKTMSKGTVQVNGPSHAQGGIELPAHKAEVEGGETIADGFVFSKDLGFADAHKPIAKAMGKIEKKPATAERLNSLKLLKNEEQKLALSQEYLKKVNGIQ